MIAPYKYPRSVIFAEALPKTATGKVQRFALRAAARDRRLSRGPAGWRTGPGA